MRKNEVIRIAFILGLFIGLNLSVHAQRVFENPHENKLKDLSLDELTDYILREKFDLILPQVMRERDIDMWIHIVREGDLDPLGSVFGSNEGVFVFTDRGGDRIERAFLGYPTDLVERSGAYDVIVKQEVTNVDEGFPDNRMLLWHYYMAGGSEWPGGEITELDYRFKGLDKFVEERNPQKIAVNYLEELGSAVLYEIPRLRPDGISHTDYTLLARKLGDKYAERMISSEYLAVDYLARPVASEFELYRRIRSKIHDKYDNALKSVKLGITRMEEIGQEVSVVDGKGQRKRRDHVIIGGELVIINDGHQSGGFLMDEWEYGNYHECVDIYAYVLKKDESQPPEYIRRMWDETLKVRKIIEEQVVVGITAAEAYERIKDEFRKAGILSLERQSFDGDMDPGKTRVAIDLHAAGSGLYAPRIGPLGPNWQRDIELPMYHHFYLEYFINVPMPEWGKGESITLRFHDGALTTENGVEYFFPPPVELWLVR